MRKNSVKLFMKNLPILNFLWKKRKSREEKKLFIERSPYIEKLKTLLPNGVSVLSSNCFAGRIMQDLKIPYNSPTLGLWIMPDDFAYFCRNVKKCLSADVQIKEKSKNAYGENKRLHPVDHYYPLGSIDGNVEIHFLHYRTKVDAIEKWKRRASRVNYEKILFIGMEQNNCSENDIKAFDSIPYEGKLFFTSKPYPYECVVYIPEFKDLGHVGDPYKNGSIFYRYLIEWLEKNREKIGTYR